MAHLGEEDIISFTINFEYACPVDGVLRECTIKDKDLIYSDIYHNILIIIKNCSCKKQHELIISGC